MQFSTKVETPHYDFSIKPFEKMLFIGSCFATGIGEKFRAEAFHTVINPFGVMYNPVSIGHTVKRMLAAELPATLDDFIKDRKPIFDTAFLTLGTNHVYRDVATLDIVDNCQKRPHSDFREERLSVDECAEALSKAVFHLLTHNPGGHVVLTISPIRYRKYGYHESQLSKATLMLAAEKVCRWYESVSYFPAYEIVNDELRDYRFYAPDMLHPSAQAVDYIWERLSESLLSPEARSFIEQLRPIKEALAHKPFNPEGEEYKLFMQRTNERLQQLKDKYPQLNL